MEQVRLNFNSFKMKELTKTAGASSRILREEAKPATIGVSEPQARRLEPCSAYPAHESFQRFIHPETPLKPLATENDNSGYHFLAVPFA